MLPKPSHGVIDVESLLGAAKDSGIQLIVCSDSTNLCCSGGEVSCVELLVEPGVEAVLGVFLRTAGFCHIQTVESAGSADCTKYLGYCEACSTLVQINVFSAIVLASSPGRQLVSRSSSSLFYGTGTLSSEQVTSAILLVRLICSAAILFQHQTRLRHSMLHRAQQLFCQDNTAELCKVATTLCGTEAARYVVKLADTNEEWEVDVLLPELWRELLESNVIEYNHHTPSVLLPSYYLRHARRLTDTEGRIANAPVLVTLQSCGQGADNEKLPKMFQKYLDTSVVRCEQVSHPATDRPDDFTGNNLSVACKALYRQLSCYLRTRKIQKMAAGGVLVFAQLTVNVPPSGRYGRSESRFLSKWSQPLCRVLMKCASVLAAKSAEQQYHWHYFSVANPMISCRAHTKSTGESGNTCIPGLPAGGRETGSPPEPTSQSRERGISAILRVLSN